MKEFSKVFSHEGTLLVPFLNAGTVILRHSCTTNV